MSKKFLYQLLLGVVKIKKGGAFFGNKKTKVESNGARWSGRNRKEYDSVRI